MNAKYRNAQEREGVITMLEPADFPADPQEGRTAVLARNTKTLQAFRKDLSSKTVEQHVGTIEDFAQTTLLEHDPARGLLDTGLSDVQSYQHAHGNKTVTTSFKRFIRFLEETGRMDYEHAEVLLEWLKQATGEPDPRR